MRTPRKRWIWCCNSETMALKILKKLLLAFVALIVLFLLTGFFLPGTYHVERSVAIKGKAEDVYPFISDLKTWNDWTAWNKARFPDMTQEFAAITSGEGASYSWKGKDSGEGTIKIVKSDPEKGISYYLDFAHGQHISTGDIRMEPAGDSVKVTWTNEGNLGMNPINRYFGLLLMDKFMGPDFEKGLTNLKAKAEK